MNCDSYRHENISKYFRVIRGVMSSTLSQSCYAISKVIWEGVALQVTAVPPSMYFTPLGILQVARDALDIFPLEVLYATCN
ncbi:hypothetical protein HNR37_001973 [Desulfurispira natronophila]|uniref:Uncharacterized protein n=1 Tax=Desulfurispira natronophila TaxID=682562 RepID=A0A7W8DHM1_9BACT|nr:hypothetical protein [Desulfurispira natronophila]